jgi:hypothetical protein
MTYNKNNNKLYHAASLAQRELEPVLNAITDKVCENYGSIRPSIQSMHELITLVIDTVFLVEMGNRLSPVSKFNANELAVCAVSRLLSWRNRHPNSCRGFEFTNEHFIDTCFEISISVQDGCTESSIDYQSLLNRYRNLKACINKMLIRKFKATARVWMTITPAQEPRNRAYGELICIKFTNR